MWFVDIIQDEPADGFGVPTPAGRSGFALLVQDLRDGGDGEPLLPDHPEDAPHDCHLGLVHRVADPGGVHPEAVVGGVAADYLAGAGLLKLAPPCPLGNLGPLELRKLIENAICQLAFGGVIATVVESAYLTTVLLELLAQPVVIGRLTGEAVPILCQHHGNAPGGHEVPHAVHTGALQAGSALSGVLHLLKDLVPFTGGVV